MEFAPTDRIATRLTVVAWPRDADELSEAVLGVTTFERANDVPTIVEDGLSQHLAWRGYLTGGLLTLYERLGRLISDRDLGAFYADARLEVFVPANGDVVVLAALRHPIVLLRTEWDERVSKAASGQDLAAGFVHEALAGAGEVLAAARDAAQERIHLFAADPPEAMPQLAPGEVDFDLLEDSEYQLTERYDPEGNLEEAWVTGEVMRWRTDFVAPGTDDPSGRDLQARAGWRVSQWEWVAAEADDTNADDQDEVEQDGDWVLRAQRPITAQDVAAYLPDRLTDWVRRMTEEGVAWATELGAEIDPRLTQAATRLRRELDDLA